MGWADIGSHVTRSRAARAAMGGSFVGFVPPTNIYDEMRAIEAASVALLGDYQRNVATGDPMRVAYENWRTNVWLPFFTKHLTFFGKLANVTDTDTLWAQTQARGNELAGFRQQYTTLTTPGGAPVPPPTAPNVPTFHPGEGPGGKPTPAPSWWPSFLPTLEVPWYVWVLGTAAIIGGGYVAYRGWKKTNEEVSRQRGEVLRMLPGLMGGGALSAAAVAHDEPGHACSQCQSGG